MSEYRIYVSSCLLVLPYGSALSQEWEIRADISLYKQFKTYLDCAKPDSFFEEIEVEYGNFMLKEIKVNFDIALNSYTFFSYWIFEKTNSEEKKPTQEIIHDFYNGNNKIRSRDDTRFLDFIFAREGYRHTGTMDYEHEKKLQKFENFKPILYFHCMYSIKEKFKVERVNDSLNALSVVIHDLRLRLFCAQKHLQFFQKDAIPNSVDFAKIEKTYQNEKIYHSWYASSWWPKLFWFWYKKPDLHEFNKLKMQHRYVKYKKKIQNLGLV